MWVFLRAQDELVQDEAVQNVLYLLWTLVCITGTDLTLAVLLGWLYIGLYNLQCPSEDAFSWRCQRPSHIINCHYHWRKHESQTHTGHWGREKVETSNTLPPYREEWAIALEQVPCVFT